MIKTSLVRFSLRLMICWLIISVFFFVYGEAIIRLLLPYLSVVTNLIAHNYSAELSLVDSEKGRSIAIAVTAIDDVYRLNIPIAPKGTHLSASGSLAHALVPIAILFTLLLSWPTTHKRLLVQVALGIPATLFILAMTTPMLLASHIEQFFHAAAQNYAGKTLPIPFMMNWAVFMEIGGIWLLPIVGAFLCVLVSAYVCALFKKTK